MTTVLVAVDPGRNKCGLILADKRSGVVLEGKVIEANAVIEMILSWQNQCPLKEILIGNGTCSEQWKKLLSPIAPIKMVDERGSTLRARQRYWELWPPNSWRRLIPRGMMLPPHDLDAVAALVLLEDHLKKQFLWIGDPRFKNVP